MEIVGGVMMTRNADKKVLHYSSCILVLSLGALIILSCIYVVPSKQTALDVLSYFCMAVVVVSLGVSASIVWKRLHRG